MSSEGRVVLGTASWAEGVCCTEEEEEEEELERRQGEKSFIDHHCEALGNILYKNPYRLPTHTLPIMTLDAIWSPARMISRLSVKFFTSPMAFSPLAAKPSSALSKLSKKIKVITLYGDATFGCGEIGGVMS